MKNPLTYPATHKSLILLWLIVLAGLFYLFFNRLAGLTGGLSGHELHAATQPLGWRDLYQEPLYLPLKLARGVVFHLAPAHGQLLSRLPNVLFGLANVGLFAWLVRLWHGNRIAWLSGLLFATSAWGLHVSRLASYDVLYWLAAPSLLLIYLKLQKRPRAGLWYLSSLLNGLMLFIPGLVWLLLLNAYLQRKTLVAAWRQFNQLKQRLIYALAVAVWLPLLIIDLTRPGQLRLWLGLPTHLAAPQTLLKQLLAVPVHLFVRGPQYPELWLGRVPILDVFTLVACLVGIYFYLSRLDSMRSRLLVSFFGLGAILVALAGPVGLSLLVPLLYLAAATGIAYLLRDWLKVFPANPIGRGAGLGLIIVAVSLAAVYNYRAYFVAWPHTSATKTIFRYHL